MHLEGAIKCFEKQLKWDMVAKCHHAEALLHEACMDTQARDVAALKWLHVPKVASVMISGNC